MKRGLAHVIDNNVYNEYLRRLDVRAVLDYYGVENDFEEPGRVDDHVGQTTEIRHSCLLDRVDRHHANGDANPSASANIELKVYVCIAPGAWVMTVDGGKPIEDIAVGDMVLTHRGRYRPVTKLYSRHISQDVIEYRPNGSRAFLITKDHKMLTAPRSSCGRCSKPHKGCRHVPVGSVGWHRGEEIADHVVVRGKLTAVVDVDRVRVQDEPVHANNNVKAGWVDVTPGLMRLVGYYLSEGYADKNGVHFCLNPQESHYADDIELLIKECFGVSAKRHLMRGGLYVRVASRGLSRFFVGQFGSGCDRKLLPSWVMTLPKSKQRELLRGLYRGDGSVSKSHQSVLTLANPPLVYQIWQILTRFGAQMSLSQTPSRPFAIRGYSGASRPQATIRWADDCSEDFREINDKSKYPFREEWRGGSRQWFASGGEECVAASWRETPYVGMVYDLEVAEDHSFVVEGVVSSNCYSYWGGNMFDFIAKMEDKEHFNDIVPILGQFLGESTADHDSFLAELDRIFVSQARGVVSELPAYNDRVIAPWSFVHPYVVERGIDVDTASRLRIGWREDLNRITIPVYWAGRLVGWQSRAIPDRPGDWPGTWDGGYPKYKSSPGLPKSAVLYLGDGRGDLPRGGRIVVVESPFSVIKAAALGLSVPVAATFGAKVSDRQCELLRGFDEVVIWADDDDAGRIMERKMVARLINHVRRLRVVTPDEGKDMGDYTTLSEVEAKIESAQPALFKQIEWSKEKSRGR